MITVTVCLFVSWLWPDIHNDEHKRFIQVLKNKILSIYLPRLVANIRNMELNESHQARIWTRNRVYPEGLEIKLNKCVHVFFQHRWVLVNVKFSNFNHNSPQRELVSVSHQSFIKELTRWMNYLAQQILGLPRDLHPAVVCSDQPSRHSTNRPDIFNRNENRHFTWNMNWDSFVFKSGVIYWVLGYRWCYHLMTLMHNYKSLNTSMMHQ